MVRDLFDRYYWSLLLWLIIIFDSTDLVVHACYVEMGHKTSINKHIVNFIGGAFGVELAEYLSISVKARF